MEMALDIPTTVKASREKVREKNSMFLHQNQKASQTLMSQKTQREGKEEVVVLSLYRVQEKKD